MMRSDSGNVAYIITTSRITAGEELKHRNGVAGLARDLRFISGVQQSPAPAATQL